MEYLDGRRPRRRCSSSAGRCPSPTRVEYVLQACEAIAEAHAHGIVHRDLKPANLFLTHARRRVAAASRCSTSASRRSLGRRAVAALHDVTAATMLGSPLYMSPEQIDARRATSTRARDIWALGVILYQLLSARMPFAGAEIPDVMAAVLTSAPAPLRTLRPDFPPELEIVVTAALEKNTDRRVPNVAVLAGALRAWAPRWARDSAARAARTLGLGERGTTSTNLGWAARAAAVAPANRGGAAEGPGDDGAGTPSRWSGWLRSRPRASRSSSPQLRRSWCWSSGLRSPRGSAAHRRPATRALRRRPRPPKPPRG